MAARRRARLRTRGPHARKGPVKVLVAIASKEPSRACLERIEKLGLRVSRVIGSKLTGEIDADALEDLERDPDVAEVEVSRRLRKHSR